MKKIFFGLLISGSAFANDPSIFTGKYGALLSEGCDLTMYANEGSSRTYVYLKRHSYHNNLLSLNFDVYGNEANGEKIVIEDGKYQTVGTSVDSHDKVTDTAKAKWISANKLMVEVRTQRPRINLDFVTVFEVTLKGKNLNLTSYIKNRPDQGRSSCDFKRVP